ncbi:MAG: hypothetical protein K2W82_17680 [Candidatus Obscuribacterales bacterium]|nr:hypothetical protein [Candidatus Obscuribacterales bacterium]
MTYYRKRAPFALMALISLSSLIIAAPALAQVSQSGWVKPGGETDNFDDSSSEARQSGWVKPDINPGSGWVPADSQAQPQQQPLSQSGWVKPGQSQDAYSPLEQSLSQPQVSSSGWVHPGQNASAVNQEPDFSQYDQQQAASMQNQNEMLGGSVTQNQGDMSGLAGALGGFSGASGLDNLGKAINSAAQMGLIPGGGTSGGTSPGMGGMNFSMPKFGSQMNGGGQGQVMTSRPVVRQQGAPSKLNNIPGVGLTKSVAGSVNRAVGRNLDRAINRAVTRSLYNTMYRAW